MTWGKRTSIDADAKSRREIIYNKKKSKGGEEEREVDCDAASFNYRNSSFEEGLSYGVIGV